MRLRHFCYIVVIVLISSLHSTVQATDYFVSKTAADGPGDGSWQYPFSSINRGMKALQPGDTLIIRGGVYEEGINDFWPAGASWALPISVKSFPGESVILRPGREVTAIWIGNGHRYIIIDGLTIDAVNIVKEYDGVGVLVMGDACNIRFQNCEFRNSPNQGVYVVHEAHTVEFINCSFHHNGTDGGCHGLYIRTRDCIARDCEFYNNSGWGAHIYFSDREGCESNSVVGCASRDNGRAGIGLYSGLGHKAYRNAIWGNENGIEIGHGSDGKIYNNTIYGNSGDGINLGPETINAETRNNIICNNGQYGIGVGFAQIYLASHGQ